MSFRGRGREGGFSKALLPFGLEYGDIASLQGETDRNQLELPIDGPITKLEKKTAQQYIDFQKIISQGPFYTGSLQSLTSEGARDKKQAIYDDGDGINDGIKRYSDKYRKKRKIARSIDEHPYILGFFPEELYSVMGVNRTNKKKLLSLSNYNSRLSQDETLALLQRSDEAKANEIMEDMKRRAETGQDVAGDHHRRGAGEEGDGEEHDDLNEEDEDDDFDEDDDDDYNAEKYFDDGDDDGDGDDDDDDGEAQF